jgi:hypothetical protein
MATQDGPVQSGSDDANDTERIDGLVDQIRSDRALGTGQDSERELRDRLVEIGVTVDDAEFAAILERVTR